jgi:hypothetical protein
VLEPVARLETFRTAWADAVAPEAARQPAQA